MALDYEIPDMTGWTDKQQADWYDEHHEDWDEIFSGETVEFYSDPETCLTTRIVPMTIKEARIYDAKQEYAARHQRALVPA